ncbi:MAG: hypothetical protein IJF69_04740 [Clostridia bacterium]|nr:hypothetical protein [Clostridia bacterium]
MFFNIPLSREIDYYYEKIDEHIKEDFETKIPDYGADAFNPVGFHFKRKGNRISGIYRVKYARQTVGSFLSPSTHMHFKGEMTEGRKGEGKLKVLLYPQLSQAFMLIVSLVFVIFFSRNIAEAYLCVVLFSVILIYSVIETVRIVALIKKEFKKFFK